MKPYRTKSRKRTEGGPERKTRPDDHAARAKGSGRNGHSCRPSFEEVRAYAEANEIRADPVSFFDYYEERGWITTAGKPVRDWKGLLHYWSKTEDRYYNHKRTKPKKTGTKTRKKEGRIFRPKYHRKETT